MVSTKHLKGREILLLWTLLSSFNELLNGYLISDITRWGYKERQLEILIAIIEHSCYGGNRTSFTKGAHVERLKAVTRNLRSMSPEFNSSSCTVRCM